MKQLRKKITIGILFFIILVGVFGVVFFSSKFIDRFQKAVAHNEEDNIELLSSEEEGTEELSTEANESILTYEDTVNAVSAGAEETYEPLSSVATIENLTNQNYSILTYDDWTKLKLFSNESTLEGKVFHIYYPDNSSSAKTWVLSGAHIGEGLGSDNYPFSGTLKPYYDGMNLQTSVTLFYSLSSKAGIISKNNQNPFTIENAIYGSSSTEGGLAKKFVLEDESVDLLNNYKNVKIKGNIDSTKTAGGLFGTITKSDNVTFPTLVLSKDISIDLSGLVNVQGSIAGGLIGEVSGNIEINLKSVPAVTMKVMANDIPNNTNPLSLTICAGGIIGKMSDGAKLTSSQGNEYLVIGNEVDGEGISGGLVGVVDNSEVRVSYIQKDSVLTSGVEPYISAKYICGGFIGLVRSSKVELSYLKLNVDVKAYYANKNYDGKYTTAGGVVGRYITDANDSESYLTISNLFTGNTSRAENYKHDSYTQKIMVYAYGNTPKMNTGGGIIGSCNGNQLIIRDVNFSTYLGSNSSYNNKEVYNVSLIYVVSTNNNDNTSNESVSGGIAGSLCGKNIEISNIIFEFVHNPTTQLKDGIGSNSLGGYYVGNIAGIVGYDQEVNIPTKMKVSNIFVKNNYIHKAKKYHGGLFGYVKKGAIICLSDTIDLSKVPFLFQHDKIDKDYSVKESVMLAPDYYEGYRGFIAGYAEESLIYFEEGTNIIRSIKTDNEGNLVSNMINADGSEIALNPDDGTYYQNCIDDIGNAGSVFQNISIGGMSVIDYSRPYGTEVTKTLQKDGSGNYIISSLADALVLAISGQAYDPQTGSLLFSKHCFESADTITEIMASNYVIATELELGEANIRSFLRNDSVYGFSGNMRGQKPDGSVPTITLNSVSKQINGGLFSRLSDGARFENLIIDGKLWYHKGATNPNDSEGGSGSIAARAEGTCTFDNITIRTWIKGDQFKTVKEDWVNGNIVNERMYAHGGLIGEYQLNGGTLTVTNCTFDPNITQIRSSSFVGGMIGRVETTLSQGGTVGNIYIDQCTLDASIEVDKNYMMQVGSNTRKVHARTAGLIAFIGNSYYNISGITNNYDGYPIKSTDIQDKTYAKITLSDISIENASIDLTSANNAYVNMSGGLLGYAWCNVETTLENISITDSVINSLGSVGGLITFITGKYDVNGINIESLKMTCVDKQRTYSALLFGNGEHAYVTIDQAKYSINTEGDSVQVKDYSQYFDEIVGINVKRMLFTTNNDFDHDINEEYRNGGILNIINSDFSNFDAATYESYTNKICETSNKYTRYYYNLFQGEGWNFDTVKNNVTITSSKQWMTWHVGSYANTNLSHFFVKYFANNTGYRNKIRFVDLEHKTYDMNGYSLYPTCIDGAVTIKGNGAKLLLYGEEISDLEYGLYSKTRSKIYRNNELKGKSQTEEYTQHYLMHSSLLYCVDTTSANTAYISDVTISGSIANNGEKTGSLIGSYAVGNIQISNIVFEGLKVSHYKDLTGEYSICGLMLGTIGVKNNDDVATNVVIDGVQTISYDGIADKPVAGALIAHVGSSSAKNIQILLKNMKLDSEISSEISSNVFQYASFMYSFDYSIDSKDNKSYGVYTFDYIDTVNGPGPSNTRDDHNVTYGKEIGEGVHYNDKFLYEIMTEEGYVSPLEDAIAKAKNYISYVYDDTKMEIFVNPKNGNITEGCGTYEDPYIINNPAQLLSLFCYLSGEHEVYRSFLRPGENDEGAWKVVPIGGDGKGYKCNSQDAISTHEVAIYDRDAYFPTVDDMRTAYYMITADIDLENTNDANYITLLKRFTGIGSYKYPFSGVIVGKKITVNGVETYPTITLPRNDGTNYTRFGLIEYMQGAVIKDIKIYNTMVTATESVGGVAAVILGGDNIIDNVKVGIKATLRNAPAAGGYVGVIENGSLIIRNIKERYVVNDCEFSRYTDGGVDGYYASPDVGKTLISDANMKVGLLVGKVEDGFVLYDNQSEFSSDKEVLTTSELPVTQRKDEAIPLVNGFDIINGWCLDEASGNDYLDRIPVEIHYTNGVFDGFEFNVYNTEQLEILALALNSDSLSVYVDERHSNPELRTSHDSGYDYTAKCRKATYKDVGSDNAKAGNSSDCSFAKAYDDGRADGTFGYLYPYLCCKYMCVSDSKVINRDYSKSERYNRFKKTISMIDGTDGLKKYISVLNKADDVICQYETAYKLRAGEVNSGYVYDLSEYKNSFRGFGALYSKKYSDFRANFDGKNCSVKIYMNRNWDPELTITGMFNSLVYDNKKADGSRSALKIKDLVIVDSVFMNLLNQENLKTVNTEKELSGAACGSATGALAGEVQGIWTFEGITLERSDPEALCGVRGNMNVGGLIGRINVTIHEDGEVAGNSPTALKYGLTELHDVSNKIEIRKCSVQGFDENNRINIQGERDAFAVGGLVGSVGANLNIYEYSNSITRCFYFGRVYFYGCSVENTNILSTNSGFLGGFVGTAGYRPYYYWRSAGKIKVEQHKDSATSNTINHVKILSTGNSNEYDKYSAGGVFGQVEVFPAEPLKGDGDAYYQNSEIGTEDEINTIKDISVNDLVINNQSSNVFVEEGNTEYNLQGNTNGIGGLIGYLSCRKMTIKRASVTNSQIGYYDFGTEDTEDDQYALTHVGGLIGIGSSNGEYANGIQKAFYTNMLDIEGAKVTDSIIATRQQEASAGGFVGYLSTENVNIEEASDSGWEKLLITNNQIFAEGISGNAGGVIGRIESSNYQPHKDANVTKSLTVKKYVEYLDMAGNTITAKGQYGNAGGIVGKFTSDLNNSYESRLTLKGVQVGTEKQSDENTDNLIVGYSTAGGLCGYINGMTYLRYRDYVRVGSETSGNTIMGKVVGGFYGKIDCVSESKKQGFYEITETNVVEILNNRIVACYDEPPILVDGKPQDDSDTFSGGVAGERSYHITMSHVTSYTLKKNVIVAAGNIYTSNPYGIICAGIFGKINYTSTSESHHYVQYFDSVVMEDNSIGYYPTFTIKGITDLETAVEHIQSEDTKLDYTSQDVWIVKRTNTFEMGNWRNFDINESNVGDYAFRIANYIGYYNSAGMHCVFLRPTLIYSKNVGSIPAIDVAHYTWVDFFGYQETNSPSDYGYSYPYEYKEKCHIIYLDDYKSDSIVDISDDSSGVKPILDSSVLYSDGQSEETEYFFGNIEAIVSNYSTVKNTKLSDDATTEEKIEATYQFLISKRLDITMGRDKNEKLICASPESDDYFSTTYINSDDAYNGVAVIEMDGQSAQHIGDYVASILTGGYGVFPDSDSSNTFRLFLNVSCVNAYIDPSGKIYAIGQDGMVAGELHNESSIIAENNILSAQGRPFDKVIETNEGKYYTITLLRYTYNSYAYNGTVKQETIYIPVFVTKKVTMNTYLSILPGEEYSLTEAYTNGRKDDVVISHDSVYTIYSEFVYDDVRMEEGFSNIQIEKTLKFETPGANDEYQPFNVQAGTKYTLVDVQTGTEYYYTVPQTGSISEIPFSEFKDRNGNSYSERNISTDITITEEEYTSIGYFGDVLGTDTFDGTVGLERYFIVVEPSGADNNVSYRISIETDAIDEDEKNKEEFVRKIETVGINITQIPGPLISFEGVKVKNGVLEGTDDVTSISGTISKDTNLEVEGRIRVSLVPPNSADAGRNGSPYWIYKSINKTIDSANAGKYLEMGITLIDTNTNKEVSWPEGTNVMINGGTPIPLQGKSVIYAYKDNGQRFSFDSLTHNVANNVWYYYDINESSQNANYQWITQDANGNWYYQQYNENNLVSITLDNIDELEERYISCSNQCHLEFDFSVADIKDYIGKNYIVKINLHRSSDPDFPLEEAGTTVSDGSIREYSKTILAEGAVDLAVAINPDDLLDLGINLYGDRKMSYEIPFTNKIDFTNMISTKGADADIEECASKKYLVVYRVYKKTAKASGIGYEYALVDLNTNDSPFTLYDVTTGENLVTIKAIQDEDSKSQYAFVTSKTFTTDEIRGGTEGIAYVTSWKMKLKVDSTNMTETDLANYKIEATYLPYDGEEPDSDHESTLKDYFIFTIANLKTDF